jgi:site-specific recombinase XerD
VIPLNSTLIRLFNEYMENDRGHCPDIADGHADALFLGSHTKNKEKEGNAQYGRKRLSERQISDIVHKYTAIVTGGAGYSPHKLRATAATTAIQRGVDMSRVAALLDHDNVSTTQRYIKVTQDDKRKAIEKMEY